MSRQPINLLEYVQATGPMRVDRDRGVIHDVKVLGNTSANGRSYPPATIEKARALYEGKVVNVDHPSKPGESTPVSRRLGWLEGLHVKDGELWARELHVLKSHPMAPSLFEAAERNPRLFGLSHNATGSGRREGSVEVIESIDAVNSVDVVSDPATVGGLNESRGNSPVKKLVKQWIEELKATRPGYARGLKEQAESGLMSPDAQMDAPPDPAPKGDEAADHETALKQGFRAAIIAVLDDDSMDLGGKVKKIKEILQMEEKLLAKGEEPADDPAPEPTEESRKAKLENLGLRLLLENNLPLDGILSRALSGCQSEKDVRDLVEDAKKSRKHVTGGARSAPARAEAGTDKAGKPITEQTVPDDPQKLASWLRE